MSLVIAVDGTDASGKKTQSDILADTLRKKYGLKVVEVSFPDYDDKSSTLVKMYLAGEFGENANDTNAYAASSFFAVDRYASFVRHWKADYESDNTVIILNRYTTSNAVHQLAKISDDGEKQAFLDWLYDYEFVKLGLPVPDLVFFLDMPPECAQKLLNTRCDQTGAVKDIHEADEEHLLSAYNAAQYTCKAWGWTHVLCANGDKIRSREDIAAEVFEICTSALKDKNII